MAAEKELVNGDGYISDDSELYGEAEATTSTDLIPAYVESLRLFPSRMAAAKLPTQDTKEKKLHFPYEGRDGFRQSNESMEGFIQRLRPSSTPQTPDGWLWVHNPYCPGQKVGGAMEKFMEQATPAMKEFKDLKSKKTAVMSGKTQGAITRALTPFREKLSAKLRDAAVASEYTHGKWMLFPPPEDVDRMWRIVGEAVLNNQLGDMAKVATSSAKVEDPSRVICIYTKNFTDEEDVKRVLNALADVGLVGKDKNTRGIYYKADAWTVAGIDSGNEYGLRPSMYSSNDMLGINRMKK